MPRLLAFPVALTLVCCSLPPVAAELQSSALVVVPVSAASLVYTETTLVGNPQNRAAGQQQASWGGGSLQRQGMAWDCIRGVTSWAASLAVGLPTVEERRGLARGHPAKSSSKCCSHQGSWSVVTCVTREVWRCRVLGPQLMFTLLPGGRAGISSPVGLGLKFHCSALLRTASLARGSTVTSVCLVYLKES